MLSTIAIAWLPGIAGTYTIEAFVRSLLIIAIVLLFVALVSRRRTMV